MSRPTLTVLHIDDDPDTRLLARELLAEVAPGPDEEVEIRWLEAPGVEEAVVRHGASRPDLILLDNRLGAEEGVKLLPRLRATWNCPVWILTGLTEGAVSDLSGEEGPAGVLSKDELLGDGRQLRSFLLQAGQAAIGLRRVGR